MVILLNKRNLFRMQVKLLLAILQEKKAEYSHNKQHLGTIPYYRVVTENWQEAKRLFEQGELYMVVMIPKGFGKQLSAGNPVNMEAMIINAHNDQPKNLRLGLDARLYLFYEEIYGAGF